MKRAFGMAPPLIDLGHEVTIYLQDSADNKEAISSYTKVKADYFHAGSALFERKQKQDFVMQNKFDVVYICGLGFGNAINPQGISNCLFLMDHVELESSIIGSPLLRRLALYFLEWQSIWAYEGSIVASRYLEFLFRRRFHRLGLRRQILWFPYAYDSHSFVPTHGSIGKLRNRYSGKKLIVYMGGLYRSYGCFEMLEAARLLQQQVSNFVFLIIGRGPEQQRAEQFVKEHTLQECVKFQGYIPESELPTFLYGADVLLSPLNDTVTDWARCPSKILMYMATKKPIVTCRIGEAWEYLQDDGFYYEPNSVDSMVATIKRAMSVADIWVPMYNPNSHTWETRVDTWLDWIYRVRPNLT
ncbi:MAG: glycosyltransferase [Pseudanabaena sp. CAN_BIN31]|nr:glycosyltransferase [Pseudanabaena sp. CAN_BIN31]